MGSISLLSTNQAVEKKSQLCRDSNPGMQGEKQEYYLSAMQPPWLAPFDQVPVNTSLKERHSAIERK